MQEENVGLKASYQDLRTELEDLKQYGRRTNLRFYSVPLEGRESSDQVLKLVENVCKEVAPHMFKFGSPIDRAHRVGKIKTENGVKTQPIIIRFLTFRDRTVIYRARKNIKEKYKYGVSLDMLPSRLSLLQKARELIQDHVGIQFVYCDINCHTRAFIGNGMHKIFNSIADLEGIIANL